jgi:hypothetical protein
MFLFSEQYGVKLDANRREKMEGWDCITVPGDMANKEGR